MIKRLAVAAIAVVGIYSAVPASAEEVGVGVGVGPVGRRRDGRDGPSRL